MGKRIVYFDLLTIVAMIGVVALHCNTLVHTFQPTDAWNQALVFEVAFYWAAPIFFMLTGANNLGYRAKYTSAEFLKRRFSKLLVPFVFWTAVIYLLQHVVLPAVPDASLTGYIGAFLTGGIEPIYWFFFAIIALTLCMPVLSLMVGHRALLWYVVVVGMVLTGVIPYACGLLHIPWNGSFYFPLAGGYIPLALLGYLLATQKWDEVPRARLWEALIYVAAVACLVFRYAWIYKTSWADGATNRTFMSYEAFTAVIPTVAVFLLFKLHISKCAVFERHAAALATVSSCSFGVFLVHPIVLNFIVFGALGMSITSPWVRFAGPLAVYALSVLVVWLIKQVPVLRRVVP